jgi:hypothetical protein
VSDDLAAQLAEWGEDFEEELNRAVAEEDDSLRRSLALLAAVEAVLKLADETDNHGRTRSPVARETAKLIRKAITGALAGEEADDG